MTEHYREREKDILHQIIWEDATRPCGDDHVTKSQNRKLIPVTSSNKRLKHKCVDLSDYNKYSIWTNFGTKLKYHTVNMLEWSNSNNLNISEMAKHTAIVTMESNWKPYPSFQMVPLSMTFSDFGMSVTQPILEWL